MDKLFQIGNFCFCVTCSKEVPVPKNFLMFEAGQNAVPVYTYRLRMIDQLPKPEGKILAKRPDLLVFETESGEARLIGRKGQGIYYAFYRELSKHEAEVIVLSDEIRNLNIDTVFTSLFALERRMLQQGGLILHCAYIEYHGKAILFSAPSETGKSTQADLWQRYRGSHTINGDRALVRKADGRWMACGWPVCGSSGICSVKDTPIHAIVMLRQGKKNYVERLSPIQAFTLLYPQITINQWNKTYAEKAIEKISDLIKNIPVWQQTCDMTQEAVNCLEHALFPRKHQEKGGKFHER